MDPTASLHNVRPMISVRQALLANITRLPSLAAVSGSRKVGMEHSEVPAFVGIAKQLEVIASKDGRFISRKLYPNEDFYSGIIYRVIGRHTRMFTVMFALGRLPGWIAQWKEMVDNKEPIGRPRQIYTGVQTRDYVALAERK